MNESRRAGIGRRAPCSRWRFLAAASFAVLAACGPAPSPSSTPVAADGWHEFEGTWSGAGRRHTIALGGDRRATLLDLQGSMLLAGPARPGVGFRAEVVALNDTTTGLVGRAVWTDERGDQIYSELHGAGTARGNRIEATFLGGTGRYAGATGSYEFTWQYVLQSEDGVVQGRAVGLQGRVRVVPAVAATAPGTPKP